jgi:hypothetical protein
MLALSDRRPDRNCQGYTRRDFLRVGTLGGAALTLPTLLAARARASGSESFVTGKSVVLLFLQGGPSHIEFFDPKMSAPAEIRSITGEVGTRIPGVTFGGTFPQLAQRTDKFSFVRSYGSKNNDHTYLSVTSAGNPRKAAMSAVYSRLAGTNHAETGMPTNVLLLPEAVQEGIKLDDNFETGALPTLTSPGELGASYGAFNPSGGGELKANLQLRIPPERLASRRDLLAGLDRLRRRLDETGALNGVDRFQQQAFDVIARGIASAFDLSKESPATLKKYDTTHIFRSADLQRYYDMRRVTNLLGRQMLLARRLCEAGCGFVTVSDCGWDMHANNNSPKGMAGMWPMGNQVDQAVSAFIDDMYERGLQDKILLVVTGEMGRTPRLNKNGGREHYGELTPLLLAGGGLKMGQAIGHSDRDASRPATDPYDPKHLMATIMHTLFDIGRLRLEQGVPRDLLKFIDEASPITELVG